MTIKPIIKPVIRTVAGAIDRNLPLILTVGGGVSSVVGFGLAIKETPKAIKLKEEKKKKENKEDLSVFESVVTCAPAYGPAVAAEVLALILIFGAHHESIKRQAAILAAYVIADGQAKDYKEAIEKTFGDKKAGQVKDKVAEKVAKETPTPTDASGQPIVINGTGELWCIDYITGRKFRSTVENVKQAFNELDDMLNYNKFLAINDLYELIDSPDLEPLEHDMGENLGWFGSKHPSGNRMHVRPEFSSQLDSNNQPCLVIMASVKPKWNYENDSDD